MLFATCGCRPPPRIRLPIPAQLGLQVITRIAQGHDIMPPSSAAQRCPEGTPDQFLYSPILTNPKVVPEVHRMPSSSFFAQSIDCLMVWPDTRRATIDG